MCVCVEPAWPKGADVLICDTGPDGEVCIPVGSVFDTSGAPIEDKDRWAECLETYGWVENEEPQGQQDTTGPELPPVISLASPSAIPILIYEKTQHPPNRMCALWYATDRFETLYESLVVEMASVHPDVLFPTWASWLRLAQDVGIHLERPIFLSDDRLVDYAGELASASVILVHFHTRYADLVDQIYSDGMNARWTFGWSGLLSCFTHLWTRDRIYIAMLNGLSLLCLTYDKHTDITQLPADIRSMLYGYAAFAVQDRAVGKKVANDRKAELLKRYKHNKGKTCRGSGLCATRSACRKLELPEEASHMDGLPSFATGWCMEYLSDLPGNQPPMYGGNHDEVEALQGSSNAWRYPYSHG